MATNVILAGGIQAETQAVLARVSTGATPNTINRIDRAIRDLKSAGIWYLLDGFFVLASDNTTLARQNWRQNSYNLTAINSPTFVASRGYTSDGATSYLDTNFALNTAGVNYSRNSASAFVYSGTDSLVGTYDMGQTGGGGTTYLRWALRSTSANVTRGQINDNTTRNVTGSNSTSLGLFVFNRSGASAVQVYQDGTQIDTDSTASVALGGPTMCFLANPDGPSFGTKQQRVAGWGASLTASQVMMLTRICKNLLSPIGAA